MALFRKGPPNVDKLRAKGDVRGLLQAVAYEEPSDAPAAARVNRPVPKAATVALYEMAPDLDSTAVEPLARVLGDSVAVAVGTPAPVIGHGEPAVRRCAAALLARIGEPAASTLAADLADYDDGVRSEVMRGLRSIGHPAVTPVTELLHADDWGVRAHAAEALGVIGDPTAVDALAEVLTHDSDGYVRSHAVVALGEIGDARAIDPLTGALDDPYESARLNAKLFLDRIAAQTPGTSTALPEIGAEVLPREFVTVADDAGPGGARFDEAIAAWNRHDMDRSAQLFAEAIEAGLDPTFGCGAEASLGQIRLDEGDLMGGVEHLLRCLGTRPITAGQAWEAAVRLQIIYDTAGRRDEARRLGDVAASANRRGLALSGEAQDRLRHLATALQVPAGAAPGSPAEAERDVPELIGCLRAADPKVRAEAVKALGATGDERAIQPLISALADDDWDVSCEASLALPRFGEAAVGPVIAALTDPSSGVPALAFRGLGVDEDDVAKLSDDDPDVRRAAEELFRALVGFPSNE